MFKKLKEKLKSEDKHENNAQAGYSAQPQQSQFHPSNPYYTAPIPQQHNISANEKYQAPPGPPPNQMSSSSGFVPPPGPPPLHYPQQPPPSWEPPPYHDWTVIPDTALLPPPPSIGYDSSPTANSTMDEGNQAFAWTQANPLWAPVNLTPAQHAAIQNSALSLLVGPTFTGTLVPQRRPGFWNCVSQPYCRDASLLTNLPAYSALWDSPLRTHRPKTIYFELRITKIGGGAGVRPHRSFEEADAGIAVGFVAPPYPTFRLPGWQRGSLGVHGDDGRRYVNDTWGGVDFTTAFKPGDVVGIGMTFSVARDPPSYEAAQVQGKIMDVDVFFTRNGVKEGGWDGNEELDAKSEGGTVGIRGECDLFPAIGVFGGVEFEVCFSPEGWVYNPY